MEYIKLMRPKHWIKNLLVFLPLVFSGSLFKGSNFYICLFGYICFNLVASCVYIMNDIKDKEKDKKHATKCNRPIASGKVSVRNAIIELFLLLIISVIIIWYFNIPVFSILLLLLYFIINVGYSFGLKNVPILDVFIVASGFLIRVLFGATLLDLNVSNWLYLAILTLSFFMALGKRRNEVEKNGDKARLVLKYYSKDFLDKNMYMFLSMAIIFYSLWATDKTMVEYSDNQLIWTIPIVMLLCMKYSMNIEGNGDGDPVEVIMNDKVIIVLGLVLVILLFLILYI